MEHFQSRHLVRKVLLIQRLVSAPFPDLVLSEHASYGVSVIMPCYNKANYICESVASVLGQTYRNLELLLIDDCSTDESIALVRQKFPHDSRIRIIVNKENHGANYCRNLGIRMASGKWVIFFDADDILHPQCFQRRVSFMNSHPDADFSVHTLQTFTHVPGDGGVNWYPKSKYPLRDFLRHDLPWQTMQPIWTKSFLENGVTFDENFKRLQDVEFHTRVLLLEDVKFYLNSNEADCYYRTDLSRVNYQSFVFMERWVLAALQYCVKYHGILSQKDRKHLLGTIFQTYLSLVLSHKSGQIDRFEFEDLEQRILSHKSLLSHGRMKRFLLRVVRVYNLHFLRLPGANRVLKKLVLL